MQKLMPRKPEPIVEDRNRAGFDRRRFLTAAVGGLMVGLAGCTTSPVATGQARSPLGFRAANLGARSRGRFNYRSIYAARPEEKFPIPAVPFEQIDPIYYRRLVANPAGFRPGTIIVDTSRHFLYFTLPGNQAIRYGVGLGRAGFEWSGRGVIQYKRQWPRWTPPDTMVARQPELQRYSIANGGMDPGLDNPLGARALYIFQDGRDTLYRIHGTPEWQSIGKSVSSGCVRMLNQDVIDLHDRVTNRAPIVVLDAARGPA